MTIDEQIIQLAHKIGAHWRDQEGVNSRLLDELAELTKPRQMGDPHTFAGEGPDCMICGEGSRHYLHDEREMRNG